MAKVQMAESYSVATISNEDCFEARSLPDVTGRAAYAVSTGGAVEVKPTSGGWSGGDAEYGCNASLVWPRC